VVVGSRSGLLTPLRPVTPVPPLSPLVPSSPVGPAAPVPPCGSGLALSAGSAVCGSSHSQDASQQLGVLTADVVAAQARAWVVKTGMSMARVIGGSGQAAARPD
jgi:hypothetical protein